MLHLPNIALCFFMFLFVFALPVHSQNGHKEPQSSSLSPAALMAFLKPDDLVLQVGEMSLAWRELQPIVQSIVAQKKDNAEYAFRQLKEALQRIALRGLYLQEARALGIELSEEEKKLQEENLAQGLAGNSQGIGKEEFVKMFAEKESGLLKLNYSDAQKVVKLGDELLKSIEVSDMEIRLALATEQSLQNSFRQQNEQKRKAIRDLLNDPKIKDDAGFASLAREYSEGSEAGDGGKLNYSFLRSDLAEVNQITEFTLQAGETSGLLETDSAFRIMRVLQVTPGENPQEPERLLMAQMLFKKFPEKKEISRDEVRERLLLDKRKKAIPEIGKSLQEKFPVKCLLFPDGLFIETKTDKTD